MRARPALVLAAALALASAGCGRSEPIDEVRETLEGFAAATADRDVQAICDRYLSRSLVEQVRRAGLPCEAALRPGIAAAREPSLKIHTIVLDGDRASARVRTSASNQPPSEDTIALVRERGEWRIASLATPGPTPPPAP